MQGLQDAAQYEIDIQLSSDTLQALLQNGYGLSVFKAVQTTVFGAAPLLWYQTSQLQMTTSVIWQTQYQAYISTSQIIANGQIQTISTADISLGQTAQATPNGVLTTVDEGTPSAVSILNQGTQPWTCGVSQTVGSQPGPVCAASLHGNMLDIIAPVEQVLLMFSSYPANPGTVVYKAWSSGVLVSLADAAQRTVQFDINEGWNWGGASWASQIPANSDLVPLLIQH